MHGKWEPLVLDLLLIGATPCSECLCGVLHMQNSPSLQVVTKALWYSVVVAVLPCMKEVKVVKEVAEYAKRGTLMRFKHCYLCFMSKNPG